MTRSATLTRPARVVTAGPEQRVQPLGTSDFTMRALASGSRQFVGHAAVFDVRAAIGNPLQWGFYEEIAPGAFTKTLQEGDARFLVDHDTALLCARVSAGDLRLAQDAVGLAVDADMDEELSYVRDLVRNVDMRRITGMSFGFYVVKDEWSTELKQVDMGDGTTTDVEVEVRRILEIRLLEVSAVTFPAYEETDAAMRALQGHDNPAMRARRAILLGTQDDAGEPPAGTPAVGAENDDASSRDDEPSGLTRDALAARIQAWAARTGLPLPSTATPTAHE